MKFAKCRTACSILVVIMVRLAAGWAAPQQNSNSATPVASATTVPRLVTFNGVIKEARGTLETGGVNLSFSLYTFQEGGSPLWTETQMVQLDDQGHYTVLLGATAPEGLPLDLFTSGRAQWLGVQPQLPGVGELPRVLLVGMPYALKAADADTLGGKPASAYITSEPTSAPGSTAAALGVAAAGLQTLNRAAPAASASPQASGTSPLTTSCGTITADGTATANFLAKFTGACVIHQSAVFESTGNVGIGNTSPAGKLDVSGNTFIRGTLQLPATGTATGTTGYPSRPLDSLASAFNSSTKAAVSQHFRWQAEPVGNNTSSPSGKFNLLFASGSGTPAETGVSLSATGNLTGKRLVSTVPTGTAPLVVSSTTQVANLNASQLGGLAASAFAKVGSANSFIGNQSVTGNISGTGSISGASLSGNGAAVTGVNAALLNGLPAADFALVTSSNTFPPDQFFNGNGRQMIVGDPGCGSGYAGIGFGALSSCNNYAMVGDGANLFLNRATGGTFYIRENNGTELSIATGGATAITSTLGFAPALTATSSGPGGEGNGGVEASGGGGGSENASGGYGLLAFGGTETNNSPTMGGDGVDAYAGTAYQGGIGIYAQGGTSNFVGGGDGIDANAGNGQGANGYSGFFQNGDVNILANLGVSGAIFAGTKDFRIDHPLDPANKYFYHASVESSEMKNIYDGTVTTDSEGNAEVTLPDWFEAINQDFRYQLTVIGQFAQAIVATKIANHRFTIKTDKPSVEVSWQVTGVRHDAFAQANRLVVEVDKPTAERGFYLYPELYGQPAEKQIEWGRNPRKMKHLAELRQKTIAQRGERRQPRQP